MFFSSATLLRVTVLSLDFQATTQVSRGNRRRLRRMMTWNIIDRFILVVSIPRTTICSSSSSIRSISRDAVRGLTSQGFSWTLSSEPSSVNITPTQPKWPNSPSSCLSPSREFRSLECFRSQVIRVLIVFWTPEHVFSLRRQKVHDKTVKSVEN